MSTQLDNLRTRAERCLAMAREAKTDRLTLDVITLEGWLDAGIGRLRHVLRSVERIEEFA